jgi:hypothetical protein
MMAKYFLCISLFFFSVNCFANETRYHTLVNKAERAIIQSKYEKANRLYYSLSEEYLERLNRGDIGNFLVVASKCRTSTRVKSYNIISKILKERNCDSALALKISNYYVPENLRKQFLEVLDVKNVTYVKNEICLLLDSLKNYDQVTNKYLHTAIDFSRKFAEDSFAQMCMNIQNRLALANFVNISPKQLNELPLRSQPFGLFLMHTAQSSANATFLIKRLDTMVQNGNFSRNDFFAFVGFCELENDSVRKENGSDFGKYSILKFGKILLITKEQRMNNSKWTAFNKYAIKSELLQKKIIKQALDNQYNFGLSFFIKDFGDEPIPDKLKGKYLEIQ